MLCARRTHYAPQPKPTCYSTNLPSTSHPVKPGQSRSNAKLLEEIRENYDFDHDAFSSIREEGAEDIKFIANDPWPDKEKQARRENQRPMVSCDLLNQYCNQVINEVRRNPREIKISPDGYGATAELAEFRENRIRAIQYKCDAQAAYITALENAVQRGYGFAGVSLRYESDTSFTQEIYIRRFPNPDAVLFDAAAKELTCHDASHCYVLDQFTSNEYRRRWPKSDVVDFSGDLAKEYPQWVKDKLIQVAEYWRVEHEKDTLVMFEATEGQYQTALLSELGGKLEDSMLYLPGRDGRLRIKRPVHNTRETRVRKVMQYITNGVEVLEENDWLGKWIPIIPIWGKELYKNEAGGSKRVLMSLIRNARDAVMSYNYFKTCQTEAAGMVPKTTTYGYEGQFEGHEQEWADSTKKPTPYLEVKAKMPDATGNEILPLPVRQPFDPPIQNLEIGAESFARAVQTSVGMYNTSVGGHDTNVKSGKAIQELDSQSDQGAFHFIDNFNRFMSTTGRVVDDLMSKVELEEREVAIRMADGTEAMHTINTEQPYQDNDGTSHHYPMDVGKYSSTVNVGPTFDSQRDEATDFLETFLKEVIPVLQDPAQLNQLLALAIKLRQLGPIGEQMAEVLVPPPGDPSQQAQQLAALQQQLQGLQQENAALHADRAGKVLEQQTKLILQQMKEDGDNQRAQLANDIKVLLAEITAKAQDEQQRTEMYKEFWLENHGAAHEAGLQAVEQQHARDLASQNAALATANQPAPEAQPQV